MTTDSSGRFDLGRFVQAQDPVFAQVLIELGQGRKRTHWMWFIFPQLAGLGHSAMAQHYAIASLAETQAYLAHPVLGPRLIECTELVNQAEGQSILQILGTPDDLKFHSSMTLFAAAAPEPMLFEAALQKYYAGRHDQRTAALLRDGLAG